MYIEKQKATSQILSTRKPRASSSQGSGIVGKRSQGTYMRPENGGQDTIPYFPPPGKTPATLHRASALTNHSWAPRIKSGGMRSKSKQRAHTSSSELHTHVGRDLNTNTMACVSSPHSPVPPALHCTRQSPGRAAAGLGLKPRPKPADDGNLSHQRPPYEEGAIFWLARRGQTRSNIPD